MPHIVVGNTQYGSAKSAAANISYDYDYPNRLDLKPGSELHERLVSLILDRAYASHRVMSKRYDSWNKIDETMTAYKWVDEDEEDVQDEDERKPTSIVFPYSYAMLETLTTYCFMALTSDPIFKYEGVTGNDTYGAMAMELLINHHVHKTKVALNLHTLIRDAMSYGIGIVTPDWEIRKGRRRISTPGSVYGTNDQILHEEQYINVVEDAVLFEGNKLTNISPYRFLPDPQVSATDIQRAEFVGWTAVTNLMEALQDETYGEQTRFNVRYLKHSSLGYEFSGENHARDRKTGVRPEFDSYVTNSYEDIHMYVTLIPEDWGIGESDIPEKWLFTLSNGEVITRASKIDFDHGQYPIAIATPDFDGYGILPISRMEVINGLQHIMDWMFNSHIANVRKSINDMLVVDPWLVNYDDVANPKAGKLIRLRRPAWGKGVQNAVQQLAVQDVTQQHIGDIGVIINAMDRVSAVDDSMAGQLRQGGPERLTKAEFQGTRGSAVSRLERIARIIGMQAIQDIGYFFASHAQQLMTEETMLRVTGDYEEKLKQFKGESEETGSVSVSPATIAVDYDIQVKDGTVPGGNFDESWMSLYKMVLENPETAQGIDSLKMFKFIARSLGAKNMSDFERSGEPQQGVIAGDERIREEVKKGNLRRA